MMVYSFRASQFLQKDQCPLWSVMRGITFCSLTLGRALEAAEAIQRDSGSDLGTSRRRWAIGHKAHASTGMLLLSAIDIAGAEGHPGN